MKYEKGDLVEVWIDGSNEFMYDTLWVITKVEEQADGYPTLFHARPIQNGIIGSTTFMFTEANLYLKKKWNVFPSKGWVLRILQTFQWKRMSKKQLEETLQVLFNTANTLEDGTDKEFKDLDYSFNFTNGNANSTSKYIDIEIYYLKMRNRNVLITGAELLDYSV